MTAPVILLIAAAASSNGVAMTREAAAACVESMQAGAKSVVRMVPTPPTDIEAAAQAKAVGADAVVLLTWTDAAFLTTEVRVSVTAPKVGDNRWIWRTVIFSARDLPAERGRALGLVIASMLGGRLGPEPAQDASDALPPAPVETRQASAPIDGGRLAATGATTDSAEAQPRWAIEANVTTLIDRAEGLDIDTVGGSLALRRLLARRCALRAALGFRVADVDGAAATTRTASAALGVVWTSPGLGRPHGIGFGARVDLLGVHEEIQRDVEDPSSPDHMGYWSAGGDLLGQVGFGLSRGTAVLAGAGLEAILTAADLIVAGQQVGTLPHLRLVLEIGILSRF